MRTVRLLEQTQVRNWSLKFLDSSEVGKSRCLFRDTSISPENKQEDKGDEDSVSQTGLLGKDNPDPATTTGRTRKDDLFSKQPQITMAIDYGFECLKPWADGYSASGLEMIVSGLFRRPGLSLSFIFSILFWFITTLGILSSDPASTISGG
jgi:hypothetical protein